MFHPHRIRGDRPPGLGLPPVVDHRDAEFRRRPRIGVRVESLAGLEQVLQAGQVVAADMRALRILLADRPDRRRCGEQRLHAVFGANPPERTGIRCADGLSLVEHRRRPGQQRPVDDVGVPHHPPDVGGRPEHVTGVDVVDVPHAPQQRDRVAAVVADDALGLARRAGRVEHIKRVGGGHRHRIHRRRGGHHVDPVHVAPLGQIAAEPVALDDHARGRLVGGQLQRVVEHRFVLHHPGRLDAAGRRDDHHRLRVVDASGQLVGGEPAEHHRVHRAEPGAGQHRDDRLRDHRHVQHHPVTLADTQIAQRTRETRCVVKQFAIAEGPAWSR